MEGTGSDLAPGGTSAARADARGRWWDRRGWLVDAVVAVAVFAYGLPILAGDVRGSVQGLALVATAVALCAACPLRRNRPVGVLAVMLVAATGHALLGAPLLVADAMLLPALHTVSASRPRRVSAPAAALVLGWLLAVTVPRLGDDLLDVGQLGVLAVVTMWVWTWGLLTRTRRRYVDALRDRAEQAERERESNARMAVASERSRIAREIHDVVSHSLSVVVVLSDGAVAAVDADPDAARSAMGRVRDTGRTALAEMRRMLGVLREDEQGMTAPQPGLAQLPDLVEDSQAAGMPVRLRVAAPADDIPASVGLTLYRVVQEALTNVRKHAADVTSVEVELRSCAERIEVRVTDDGRGSSSPSLPGGGQGHVGMRERLRSHGGSVTAGPRSGGGYEVMASVPWRGDADDPGHAGR